MPGEQVFAGSRGAPFPAKEADGAQVRKIFDIVLPRASSSMSLSK
jgi:hypothetical protein